MKTTKLTSKLALAFLASFLTVGCVAEGDDSMPQEDVGTAEDEVLGGIFISPFNLAFDACTPSINFRLTAMRSNIGFLAIDPTPFTPMNLGLFTTGVDGVLSPLTGVSPILIDGALLASVQADLALAMTNVPNVFFGPSFLLTDAQIDLLMAQISLQTQTALLGLIGVPGMGILSAEVQLAMLRASTRLALSGVSANTLIFPNLIGLNTANLVLGATFVSAPTAFTRLNVFGATSTGRLRTLNLAMPFLPSCGGINLGLGTGIGLGL